MDGLFQLLSNFKMVLQFYKKVFVEQISKIQEIANINNEATH